jgi:hypothetical protein
MHRKLEIPIEVKRYLKINNVFLSVIGNIFEESLRTKTTR